MNKHKVFSQFFRGYKYTYLVGVILLVIINVLSLQMPRLTGQAIESLLHDKEGLLHYIGWMVLIVAVITIFRFGARHLLLGSIRRFEFMLRRQLFHHALYIPTAYYEKNGPGKVMALMTNDVTSLRVSLGLGMMLFVDAIFFGVLSFIYMAGQVSWGLAVLTILPMPFLLTIVLFLSRRMRKKQRAAQNSYSDLTEFAQELFLGMPVIRAFNKEWLSIGRFSTMNKENYKRNMAVTNYDTLLAPLTYVAPFLCYAINIYICGRLIAAGSLNIGDFVAVNGYLLLVIGPIMGLGALASVLQKGFASLDRITAFLAIEEEPDDYQEGSLPLGDIAVKDLSFTYPESTAPVIKDVSLNITPGSFIGIVGAPGSGKSTLFKLLLRLQEPPAGTIFIDGQDVTTVPLSILRRTIAYVPSQSFILGTTIGENISFGESPRQPLDIAVAASRAALDVDLDMKLKGKKSSNLKERGSDLSGGQKQRVAIARGLFKNAPYLLLDDSVSALDAERVGHIVDTLRSGEEPQTLLFISQRLEALQAADRILVWKDGSIVEAGTHDELLAMNGEYCRLYQKEEGGDRP